MKEFNISKVNIRKNSLFLLWCVLCGLLFIFAVDYVGGRDLKASLGRVTWLILLTAIVFGIEIPLVIKRRLKMKLIVSDNSITSVSGRKEKSVAFDRLAVVNIVRGTQGNVEIIKLRGGMKESIRIYGLEEMDKVAELIKIKAPASVSMQVTRQKINWTNPIVACALTWISMGVMLALWLMLNK